MGLFDALGDLLQAGVEVIKTPVNVVTDVAGLTNDATSKGISKVGTKLVDVADDTFLGN